MTILDPLTGVYNKRYFLEFLDRELSRASRHGHGLALILFDIDHFKNVNDQFGHLAGDAVLREIGKRVRPRQGALIFADAVRIIIEREPIRYEDALITITVSLGVAVIDKGARVSTDEVIRMADERLYEAKRAGRNRVEG